MLRQNISIIDPSLKNGITSNHKLVVKVSKNNLTYSIFDASQNMFAAFVSYYKIVDDDFGGLAALAENNSENFCILKQRFGKTIVLIDTSVHTLIPEKLFIPDETEKYTEFSHSSHTNEKVQVDTISKISAKNVYRLPYETESFMAKTLLDFEYRHITTTLIASALSDKENRQQMLVHFSGERFDVLVTDGNSLKFCNSFVFHTAQDIMYYLLNVCKQLEFDPFVISLTLTGEIERESQEFEIIYKYIRNVFFMKYPEQYQYCNKIKEIPQHIYSVLFNSFLLLC